jgi:hypothetical protein
VASDYGLHQHISKQNVCTWSSYSEGRSAGLQFKASPWQIVQETQSRKNPSQKRAGRVAQGVGPEFKPQCHQKKKKIVCITEHHYPSF